MFACSDAFILQQGLTAGYLGYIRGRTECQLALLNPVFLGRCAQHCPHSGIPMIDDGRDTLALRDVASVSVLCPPFQIRSGPFLRAATNPVSATNGYRRMVCTSKGRLITPAITVTDDRKESRAAGQYMSSCSCKADEHFSQSVEQCVEPHRHGSTPL